MNDEQPMIGESRRAARRDARRAERDRLVREALMAGAGPFLAQEAVSSVRMSHDDIGTHAVNIPEEGQDASAPEG